jgi:methylglyoxal synthase
MKINSIGIQKHIALVAQDNKKSDLLERVATKRNLKNGK